jgi:DMSO/TMAO reductase YedYZ heme-binding membrane subunit
MVIAATSDAAHSGARRHSGLLLTLGLLGGLLTVGASQALYGNGADGWELTARFTARFAMLIFLPIFVIGPLTRLWRNDILMAIMRDRRGLGLAFTMAFSVHLTAVFIFLHVAAAPFGPVLYGTIGFIYCLMLAMAFTSNDTAVRLLGGRAWKWLHRIGLYPLAILFAEVSWTSVKASLSGHITVLEHVPHKYILIPEAEVSLMVAAFALRIFVFVRGRLRRRATGLAGATSSLAPQ